MYEIVVFQQEGSAEHKIRGIQEHGRGLRIVRVVDVESGLPEVVDAAEQYLPDDFQGDLVLDFLKHPDLRVALAELCLRKNIPVVSSGKKIPVEGVISPPT